MMRSSEFGLYSCCLVAIRRCDMANTRRDAARASRGSLQRQLYRAANEANDPSDVPDRIDVRSRRGCASKTNGSLQGGMYLPERPGNEGP